MWLNAKVGTEYPRISSGFRKAVANNNQHKISDETFEAVDEALALMQRTNPELFEAFYVKYVVHLNLTDKKAHCQRKNISQARLYGNIQKAECYIGGFLKGRETM